MGAAAKDQVGARPGCPRLPAVRVGDTQQHPEGRHTGIGGITALLMTSLLGIGTAGGAAAALSALPPSPSPP